MKNWVSDFRAYQGMFYLMKRLSGEFKEVFEYWKFQFLGRRTECSSSTTSCQNQALPPWNGWWAICKNETTSNSTTNDSASTKTTATSLTETMARMDAAILRITCEKRSRRTKIENIFCWNIITGLISRNSICQCRRLSMWREILSLASRQDIIFSDSGKGWSTQALISN